MHSRLVLNATARHPLRRSFPRALTLPLPDGEPIGDLKLFALTFASGFVAFLAFLS